MSEKVKGTYKLVIFGEDKDDDADTGFPGNVYEFPLKSELDAWLNEQHVKPHKNTSLAGRCLMQLPDERACMILSKCHPLILKTTVSTR